METLEIEIVDYGEDFLVARMPVTPKVHQPDGVLHGGATAALAESVGSYASHIFIDVENFFVRGIEITANHLKSVRSGFCICQGYVYSQR
jgi:1,4-dihydroxy-2-naphthoyl-CoA hydrolase